MIETTVLILPIRNTRKIKNMPCQTSNKKNRKLDHKHISLHYVQKHVVAILTNRALASQSQHTQLCRLQFVCDRTCATRTRARIPARQSPNEFVYAPISRHATVTQNARNKRAARASLVIIPKHSN